MYQNTFGVLNYKKIGEGKKSFDKISNRRLILRSVFFPLPRSLHYQLNFISFNKYIKVANA